MTGAWSRGSQWRSVFLTLAAAALFVRILVPPGYMTDPKAASFHLVICTGHGALDLGQQGDKDPAHKSADAPCAFAGAVTPLTPPLPALVAAPVASPIEVAGSAQTREIAPGRGLAAPPPPSQGPPLV